LRRSEGSAEGRCRTSWRSTTGGYHSHKGGKEAKGISNLKRHLKYLEFGKEHRRDPEGFTGRAEFLEQVQNSLSAG
jgi:hypothetical protein